MLCPMCQANDDAERVDMDDGVYVFCCPRCITGVLRTFAAHHPERRSA